MWPGGHTFAFQVSPESCSKSPTDVDAAKFPPAFSLDPVCPYFQICFSPQWVGPEWRYAEPLEVRPLPSRPPSHGTATPRPIGRPVLLLGRLVETVRPGPVAVVELLPFGHFLRYPREAVMGLRRRYSPAGRGESTGERPASPLLLASSAKRLCGPHTGPLTTGDSKDSRGRAETALQAQPRSRLWLGGRRSLTNGEMGSCLGRLVMVLRRHEAMRGPGWARLSEAPRQNLVPEWPLNARVDEETTRRIGTCGGPEGMSAERWSRTFSAMPSRSIPLVFPPFRCYLASAAARTTR